MRIKASRYLQKKKKNIISLVTVGQTYYTLQYPLAGPIKKKKNVGPDWKEAHQTRGLIIHDSTRKPISVIVSLYIFFMLKTELIWL